MPNAPQIFAKQLEAQPVVDMQFEVAIAALSETHHEVAVRSTVTIKADDKVMMIAEVKQAGIFLIQGFDEQQMIHIGNVVCPSIVYPYLRANMADLVTRTTMAPVHLPEMNFEALFQQRLAEAQAQAQAQQN
jgi:preprotein translocase subunit SecB